MLLMIEKIIIMPIKVDEYMFSQSLEYSTSKKCLSYVDIWCTLLMCNGFNVNKVIARYQTFPQYVWHPTTPVHDIKSALC